MEISRKNLLKISIGIILTVLMVSLLLIENRFRQKPAASKLRDLTPFLAIEDKLLDYRFKLRGHKKPPDTVVIAAIDEKSIEKLGRWPWSRDKLAGLVNKLSGAEAEIIVFDIILSETEKNDKVLGKAVRDAGNVILPVVFDREQKAAVGPDDLFTSSALASVVNPRMFDKYSPIIMQSVLLPAPDIIRETMALGHINMFPDDDGTLRWESMLIGYNGHLYPSVTLQAASTYLGVPPDRVEVIATEGIRLGKRYIPTDRWGRTLINYYGQTQTFRHISISDILDGSAGPEFLKGRIVLIGATAVGIYDLRVTPFDAAMPGIEKHASVISSILENRFVRGASMSVNLAVLMLSGLLFSVVVTRFKATGAAGITGLFLLLILSGGYYVFAQKGLWINITYPSLNVLLTFISVTAYSYAIEEKFARRIKSMFSSYVTERVVNELIKNPDMAKLGGERREISILFSDIRGFTTFSEKHSPEEVVSILNEYLGEMTGIVFAWEGTLDKFIGDAILAFWGAPMRQENHAELAVKCGLAMIKRLGELQQKWAAEGKGSLDIGVGINTGEVIVGNIGAEGKKMDYTVIGDHVNLGSRVEALTRKYNVHVLITEFTLDKIRGCIGTSDIGHVSVKGLERVIVKGKEKPVGIYEISSLGHGEKPTITECADDKVVRLKEK